MILGATRYIWLAPREINTHTFYTHTGHAWDYNIWRIVGLAYAFSDGEDGRWLQSFSFGWGYPLFHYTGSLPYAMGALFYLAGIEINAALNWMWLVTFFGAGLGMFWVLWRMLGPWPALLGATCYTLAPYHLVDTFVRTNLGEFAAFCWPPFLVYALWLGREQPKRAILLGAIPVALLPLTHILSSLLVSFGITLFSISLFLFAGRQFRRNIALSFAGMHLLGFSLAAYFLFPAVADLQHVRGSSSLTNEYNDYHKHFVYPQQLVSSFWEYGESSPGPIDYMSFSLGPAISSAGMLALLLSIWILLRSRKNIGTEATVHDQQTAVLCLVSTVAWVGTAFMTLSWSTFLWELLPRVEIVQFPWRFLLPACTFLAIAVATLPALLECATPRLRSSTPLVSLTLGVLVIFLNWGYCRAGNYDYQRHSKLRVAQFTPLGIYTTNDADFMPKTVSILPSGIVPEQGAHILDNFRYDDQRIISTELANGKARVELAAGRGATLILNQHWHPAWRAYVDGREIPTRPFVEHPYAPIAIDFPNDAYIVEFRFGHTVRGRLGLWLSMAAFLVILAGSISTRPSRHTTLYLGAMTLLFGLPVGWEISKTLSPPRSILNRGGSLQESIEHILARAELSVLAERKQIGTAWDAPANVIFDDDGLRVPLGSLHFDRTFELSADSNDHLTIIYLQSGRIVGRQSVPPLPSPIGGLGIAYIQVADEVLQTGYDELVFLPRAGDGRYALGHVILLGTTPALGQKWPVIESKEATLPPLREVPYQQVSKAKALGTEWDQTGNVVLERSGVAIKLEAITHSSQIELSTDNNDFYTLIFFHGERQVGLQILAPPQSHSGGLVIHRVSLSEALRSTGYDRVVVLPVLGDDRFAVGHFIVHQDKTAG